MTLRDQPNLHKPSLDPESLAKMMQLAGTVRHYFVATVNEQGTPHLATAEHITLEDWDLLAVTAWFCPQTAKNVQTNPAISLVVWDSGKDMGFQVTGEVEQVVEVTMPNGYIPGETVVYPQIERKLMIRVRQILNFGQARHRED
jgi:hypothetical protein